MNEKKKNILAEKVLEDFSGKKYRQKLSFKIYLYEKFLCRRSED